MISIRNVEELISFAAHLGDRISIDRLNCIALETENTNDAYADCKKYVFTGMLLEDNAYYSVQFRAIPPLLNYWRSQGISFYVYMFLTDGILSGGQIHKIRHTCRDSPGYEQEPSFQEIRLVRRILDYITEEKTTMNDKHEDISAIETSREQIEAKIRDLLKDDPNDMTGIEAYILENEHSYPDNLDEFTFREAVRCGAKNYVEANAGNINLNDCDGYCSYIYDTDDPKMKEILIDNGGFRDIEDFYSYRFAVETQEWRILTFDSILQQEVYKKYLEKTGLTEDFIYSILLKMDEDEDYCQDDDPDIPDNIGRDLVEDFCAIGLCAVDGKVDLYDMKDEENANIVSLLEELGFDCIFEGDSWRFGETGVYYID